ncbi:hypothetical protein QSV08_03340 [Maribacter sp. BPC-D8]|uniref:hypothetical protein n=1 Tax=Maribacter sp. BPC-D8 TaxID=3053613 RepID=UPI002B47C9FE|nr:hypothetical protein [Maribacter sp. BPC-D8]WRI30278.1 hypothetical protein QSV08_03340 [Maribacter sp. BPC-D8]
MNIKVFKYKSKFSFWVFLPAILFLGLFFYSYLYNANITYKGRHLLEYPNSYYVTGLIAILFLAYAVYKLIKHRKSIQNKNDITISEHTLSFPHKNTVAKINLKKVDELYFNDDSDDDEVSVILYINDRKDRYEFFLDFFESVEKFTEFKTHLEKMYEQK